MPSYLRQQKPHFGSLRRDAHWSTRGLVGYWPFTVAGRVIDLSSLKNDGIINGAIWQGAGLVFDGADDDVNINPLRFPNDQGNWSLGGIIHPTSAGEADGGRIAESSTSLRFRFSTAGGGLHVTRFVSGTDGVWQNDTASGLIGVRSHFFLTQEVGQLPKFYINGVFKYELTEITPPASTPIDLNGTDMYFFTNAAHTRALDGSAENFTLYNRVLLASEIQALYRNPQLPIQAFKSYGFVAAEPPAGIPILRRRRECA